MKPLIRNHKCIVSVLLAFFMLSLQCMIYQQEANAQMLNVGEERTVRLFYFLPNDRPYRQEVVDAMKTGIVEIQTFFADQMEIHGHSRKTFQIETDAQDNPIVHRVDGDYKDSHYSNKGGTEGEIARAFDNSKNIILVVMDVSRRDAHGRGVGSKSSGWAVVYGEWNWFAAAHELGHAFGLQHDFRDRTYILSYGRADRTSAQLSACAAEFLTVNPYFNSDIPLEVGTPPTLELISPTEYPSGSESVPIRLRVRDDGGLHQVFLFVKTEILGLGVTAEVKACHVLAGETDTVVEFNFDGTFPSDEYIDNAPENRANFSNTFRYPIFALAVDMDGNRTSLISFVLAENSSYNIANFSGGYPIVFSSDGTAFASPVTRGVRLWNASTRAAIATLTGHTSGVYSVSFSPDGTTLASGSADKTVKLWDVATRTNTATLTGHTALVKSVVFSPDGTMLASASDDDTVKLWDVATRTNTATLTGHTNDVHSVVFSPDGTTLASGSADKTVKLWDVATRTNTATLQQPSWVYSVDFSPDGTTLAAAAGGRVKLWNVARKENIATLTPRMFRESVTSVSFSPDGAILALGSGPLVELWDTATRERVATFAGHTRSIKSVSFSSDGTLLVSSDSNGKVKLWDVSEWSGPAVVNTAPKFTASSTSRTVPENTAAGVNIGTAIVATDADNDTLNYTLGGTDAAAFSINSSTGQLQTKAPLDYETKAAYTVTVTVSDGIWTDTITVTINITDVVGENSPPVFTNGTSTTRTILENTTAGVNIGTAVSATDADNDTLTYTLGGTDAAAFSIVSTSGQLQTKAVLDYKTKTSYAVTVAVSDGNGGSDSITVTINVTNVVETPITPVNARTQQVQDAIVTAVPGVNNADDVTPAHLAAITFLNLYGKSITSLKSGDFDALTGLTYLILSNNNLSSLPSGIFDDLTALNYLYLHSNDLTTLPSDIFDELIALKNLSLAANDLTTLPSDIFENLTALSSIQLQNNALSSLPEGIFENLTALSDLYLSGNTIDPFPITVSLEKVTNRQFKAVAPTGAPFDIVLPLTVTNGSISGGATTVTISRGSVESSPLTVTRASGTTAAVTVDIGTLPGLPQNSYSGFALVKSTTDLPLTVISSGTINSAPVFTEGTSATRTVAENTASSTNIGSAVAATDADNDTLTYRIGGIEAAPFDIDSTTGQLKTKAALDYETKSTYTVTVSVSDGSLTDVITVTINITDVAENNAPVFTAGTSTTRSIAENTEANVNIGSAIAATDADKDTLTYTLSGIDAASFDIDSTTGQLKTKAALDYETKTFYAVTITASDGNSGTDSITVTITVTDVNENTAPVFTDGTTTTRTVAENTAANTNIGTAIAATDADTGDTLTYTLGGTDAASFSIVSTTGQLQTKAALDYETKTSYAVTVTVSDGSGGSDSTIVTINVTDVNENTAPVFTDGTSTTRTIAKNTAANINIGSPIAATDADTGDTLTYTLSGTDAAAFNIVSTSGQLQTKAALDYETKFSYTVTVTVSDGNGGIDSITVTINVTDVTPPLSDRTPQVRDAIVAAVPGVNNAADVTAAHLAAITSLYLNRKGITSLKTGDFDGLTALTLLSLISNSISDISALEDLTTLTSLYLSGNSISDVSVLEDLTALKNLWLSGNPISDYGPLRRLIAAIEAIEDHPGLNLDITVPAETTNNTPVFTDGTTATRTIAENTAANINIGSPIAATDADNDTLTYTLSGTDAASFSIVSTTGQLQTKAALDYETKTSYAVTITASDDNGGSDSITVTINVTDVNENTAPVFTDGTTVTHSIAENTAANINIGSAVSATDADNDTLTYTLGGTDAASFSIVSTSGQLQTKAALDYETKTAYSVTVSVSDGNGGSDSITVTINVTDVTEGTIDPPLSQRTSQVRDAIVAAVPGVNNAADVTLAHLAAITSLILDTNGALYLRSGDFSGLSSLITLEFRNNGVLTLPKGVFTGLSALETLRLANNGVLTLSEGVFTGLSALETLRLANNGVLTLPEGIFTGLSSLTTLEMRAKTLTVSLEKVADGQFKAIAPTGAPFDMVLPITVSHGSISSGATTVTIPKGSAESGTLTVTRTTGTTAAVTVDVGTLPSLPQNHQGYTLVKSADLPLEVITGTNIAPVFTDGTTTTRTVAENTAANTNIGTAIAATDADTGDTLTYTLGGTDASSFSIISTSGQLQTKAALDYETQTSYTVTVTVSDGNGGSNSITVTINVTDVTEGTIDPPLSARTPQVRDAIVAALRGVNSADDVTEARLAEILQLDLENKSITSLKIGDFNGLTSLTGLSVRDNQLTTLPADIFDGLTALTTLNLENNKLSTLPVGIFADLTELHYLTLADNQLTTLPAEIFEGPSALWDLWLDGNRFTTLPTGLFKSKSLASGFLSLRKLYLEDNTVDPLPLTLSLEKVADGQLKAVAPAGATFDIVLPISVTNGSINGGATTVTIPKGHVESETLTVTRTSGTTAAVTVNIGILPSLPQSHEGYVLRKSTDLPLEIITDTNTAPVFTDGTTTTRTVAENTAADTNIGTPITATDTDRGDTLTYTLSGTDAASFSIVSTSGQLQTKAALDYETKTSYSVTVSVSDGNGGSDSITVTINVTDVNENTAPVFTDGTTATRTIAENTAANTNIGTAIAATDTDNGDTLTYTLSGTDAASFSIVSTTGQLQTKAALDYETKTSYAVTITVSDGSGGSDSITVTINVTDVNENTAPVFTDGTSTTRSIAENTAASTNIGTAIAATDADTGDTLTYTLGGTDAASFSIVSTTGQLQTKAALDYETKTSYSVTISVSDGNGGSDSITVTINVTDVNETPANTAPVFSEGDSITITMALPPKGNTEGDYDVGNPLFAADADGDSVTYSLSGTDAGLFNTYVFGKTVNGQNQSHVQLTTRGWSLHDANKSSFTVIVTASDRDGGSNSITVTINVTAETENNAPVFTDGASTTRTVAENTAANINIGSPITATDADNDTLTYTLGGTDAASFSIVSTTGQLQTKTALDYETKTAYAVTITVSDGSLTDTITLTINVTDIDIEETIVTIPGICQVGDVLAPGESCTYPDTDVEFSVNNNGSGQFLFLTAADNLNIKDTNINGVSYTLVAKKLASGSWEIEQVGATAAQTRNTAPVFTDGTSTTRSIAENTASGQHIGTAVAATDADNDTLTYTLSGTDATSFGIDSTTGQLKTKAALDYETKNTYSVTITVSDGSLTDTIDVTINITDVNELPTPTAICKVGNVLAPGESCTYPGTEAVFSVLDDGKSQWNIPNLPTWLQWVNQTSVSNSMNVSTTVNGQAYHFVAEELADNSWEIKEIADDTSQRPETDTPEQPGDTGGTPTPTTSTIVPLTEATLNGGIITLSIDDQAYETSVFRIRNAVSVTGIPGVTVDSVERVSNMVIAVELAFNGNIDTDTTLTFTVDSGAIVDYTGPAFTAQTTIPAVTESVVASAEAPLTGATLDESIVTLTLSGRKFEQSNFDIRGAVSVTGITGVTVRSFDIDRQSDTEVTVELTYDGDMTANGTLTFTVGAGAIAGYNGPALTDQVSVSASTDTPVVPETPIETATPVESDYDHIEGPWLWMIAPGGSIDIDNLSKASEGVITEAQIAQTGVNEGDHFNDLQWTSGRLLPTTVCGILLCSSDNVINVVREIGLTDRDQLSYYSAYALINISSPHAQNDVLMGVGSDDSIKVWLNGSVVYENDVSRRTTGIQNRFPVNLNAGDNLLLIKVCNHGALWVNNDWGMFFKLYLDTQDYTLSLPTGGTGGQQPQTPQQPQQPINTGGTPTLTASTASPLKEATLDESVVTLTLSGAKYERSIFNIRGAVSVSGISGVTVRSFDIDRQSDTEVTVELTFNGNLNADGTLTLTVAPNAIADYNGPALTAQVAVSAADAGGQNPDPPETSQQPGNQDTPQQPGNTGGTTLSVSTAAPLTEATLHESIVTLTLSSGTYKRSWRLRSAVSIAGITGIALDTFDTERISDTKLAIKLEFDGNINTDSTLTITLDAGAIVDYNGAALTAQIPVTAVSESITASTAAPLTEATLDESVVTLTLSGRKFERWNSRIRPAVSVSGISGVTVRSFDIDRESDTEVTVELTFNGNLNADGTLTFTIGAGAIAGYNGPALTAQVAVSAGDAPADAGGQNPDPPETPQQPGNQDTPQQPIVTGGTTTITASTAEPLTEATLHGSVVTLTLSGRAYIQSEYTISRALTVSGIKGATFNSWDVDRVNDTKVTVELTFNGNFDADTTLTFTMGRGAIEGYDGPALTTQVPVTGGIESVAASTNAPLTEVTLDESVVTLTLSGRIYDKEWLLREAVTVSGINGITVGNFFDVDRINDTQITVQLTFNGDFDTDAILTFTVEPGAIEGYDGPALTAQLPVSGGHESIAISTETPLTEATLDGSRVTLTLSGAKYASLIFDIRDNVTVSGIAGVTIPWHQPRRKSDTQITVELEFDGDMNADGTLTFTVEPDAIAGYNGPALTAQVSVTADRENALFANFPNPFNPETWIPYQLEKPAEVTITIYAIDGKLVRTLDLGHQAAGVYQNRSCAAYWDGKNAFGEPVASGVYFYTLTVGDFNATRKMLIQK